MKSNRATVGLLIWLAFLVMSSLVRAFDAQKATMAAMTTAATTKTTTTLGFFAPPWNRLTAVSTVAEKLMQRRASLMQSIPPTVTKVHVIILVHGWMGNPLELGYLQDVLHEKASAYQDERPDTYFVIHSALSNDGRTMDGIAAGGARVAGEVNEILQKLQNEQDHLHPREVSLSFVGNSLGGLYARYALSKIPFLFAGLNAATSTSTEADALHVIPKVFCTTATPHLGVSEHTYLPIPRTAEYVVAAALRRTGLDLFRFEEDVIQHLATDREFVEPLRRFQVRLAYINAHHTDFQVPTKTAAFLAEKDDSIAEEANHRRIATGGKAFELMRVETIRRDLPREVDASASATNQLEEQPVLTGNELARRLDDMGWIKVFCDVREHLLSVRLPSLLSLSSFNSSEKVEEVAVATPLLNEDKDAGSGNESTSNATKDEFFTSSELLQRYGSPQDQRWHAPFGHTVLVANARNRMYEELNAGGKPIMDQLASELMHHIVSTNDDGNSTTATESSSCATDGEDNDNDIDDLNHLARKG